jgi:glycerol-3-phosphate dehydrogenase (NAD(P)+)
MMKSFQHFGVIGAGAWGTALAQMLRRADRQVSLWAHNPDTGAAIKAHHENTVYLPGVALDPAMRVTDDLGQMEGCDALILAVPAQHVRGIAKQLATGKTKPPLIMAAKGIERGSGALMSDIAAQELPGHAVAVLSGPSFAREIAQGLPAALTLAIEDAEHKTGLALQQAMATPSFRLYLSDDMIGAQIGGAVKNVIAVACGIVLGRQLGENARAAVMTRGLAEMTRLGLALGGRSETMMGLAGLGDLVLTCSSLQSRNMSLGFALGEGQSLREVLATRTSVAEGVSTAAAALALAHKHKVDMPITAAVEAVLNGAASIEDNIALLLARPLKAENPLF